MKKYKGFTLLELIAVISILLVIASVAIPQYTKLVDRQKIRVDITVASQLANIAKTCYIETGKYDKSSLGKYFDEVYGKIKDSSGKTSSIPESEYLPGNHFDVSLSSDGRATVTLSGTEIIENDEMKKEIDIINSLLGNKRQNTTENIENREG